MAIVEVYLEEFETEDLIEELEERGYLVAKQEHLIETIEIDIRGCEIRANGEVYRFGGMIKITVERE